MSLRGNGHGGRRITVRAQNFQSEERQIQRKWLMLNEEQRKYQKKYEQLFQVCRIPTRENIEDEITFTMHRKDAINLE